jgi:hypothetical protein
MSRVFYNRCQRQSWSHGINFTVIRTHLCVAAVGHCITDSLHLRAVNFSISVNAVTLVLR